MEFAHNLKRYREKAGYKTAKDFSQKLGIPYTTYIPYENGNREPKYSLLIVISDLLHVSIDELLGHSLHSPNALQECISICEKGGLKAEKIKQGQKDTILISNNDSDPLAFALGKFPFTLKMDPTAFIKVVRSALEDEFFINRQRIGLNDILKNYFQRKFIEDKAKEFMNGTENQRK